MEETPRRAAQRANKPLTEKKRRLRINASLEQIKYLVMEAIGQDPNNITTKFEKADVLELTVRYLQNQKMTNPRNSNPVLQYKDGYRTCVQDVASFLDQNDGADSELKSSMLEHLDHCMERFDKVNGLTLRRGSKVSSSGVSESMDFVDGQAQVVNQSGTSTPTPVQNIQTLQTVQIAQPLQDLNQNIVQKQQPVTSKPQPVSNNTNQPVPVRLIRSSQAENVIPQTALTNPNQTVPVQVIQTSQAENLVPQNATSVRLPHIPVQFDQNQMSNAVFAQVLGLPPIQSFAPAQNSIHSTSSDVAGVYSTLANAQTAGQSSTDAYQTYTVLQPVKTDPALTQVNGEFYRLYNQDQGYA